MYDFSEFRLCVWPFIYLFLLSLLHCLLNMKQTREDGWALRKSSNKEQDFCEKFHRKCSAHQVNYVVFLFVYISFSRKYIFYYYTETDQFELWNDDVTYTGASEVGYTPGNLQLKIFTKENVSSSFTTRWALTVLQCKSWRSFIQSLQSCINCPLYHVRKALTNPTQERLCKELTGDFCQTSELHQHQTMQLLRISLVQYFDFNIESILYFFQNEVCLVSLSD